MAKRRAIGVLVLFACSGFAVAQQEGDPAKDLAKWPVSPFWAPPQSIALEKLKEQTLVEPMAIEAGDLLTTSSTPGYAMKATPVSVAGVEIYPGGTILGKALTPLTGEKGKIRMLVLPR